MPGEEPPGKPLDRLRRRVASREARDIDDLYGLEPIYEPGADGPAADAESFVAIACPWCGERLDVRVDVTGGEREYVDDCEVCCRPMELVVEIDERGGLAALRVRRQE